MTERKSYSFVDFRKLEDGKVFGCAIAYTTRPVELRQTSSGKSVANTGLALNNVSKHFNYVLGTNFPEDAEVLFVELSAWEKTGEMMANANIPKGSLIAVTGFLGIEEYEGKKRLRINVSRFRVLKWQGDRKPQSSKDEQEPFLEEEVPIDTSDDDLPF